MLMAVGRDPQAALCLAQEGLGDALSQFLLLGRSLIGCKYVIIDWSSSSSFSRCDYYYYYYYCPYYDYDYYFIDDCCYSIHCELNRLLLLVLLLLLLLLLPLLLLLLPRLLLLLLRVLLLLLLVLLLIRPFAEA